MRRTSCGVSRTGLQASVLRMPLYFFSVPGGRTPGCSDCAELTDRDAAWKELTGVCGDMVGSICRNLQENDEWQMVLLDASKKPLFRIRLLAETLDQGVAGQPNHLDRVHP